jgi:hypothetical protein
MNFNLNYGSFEVTAKFGFSGTIVRSDIRID